MVPLLVFLHNCGKHLHNYGLAHFEKVKVNVIAFQLSQDFVLNSNMRIMLLSKLGLFVVVFLIIINQQDLRPVRTIVTEQDLGVGSQPEIAVSTDGIIRIVYGVKNGKERDLYYVSSSDGGQSYSKPFIVGNFSQMGLGMGRGPQLTTTKDYSVVTVGDHHGNLFAVNLSNRTKQWSMPVKVNETDTTAKEALSGLGAGKDNFVYTA